ncbi:hypothetical protein IKE07_01245 [Candidatus Saccharibacteria bacterium]|nr:hypothetical protein [Candidatus Saccharibacteria bacterium]
MIFKKLKRGNNNKEGKEPNNPTKKEKLLDETEEKKVIPPQEKFFQTIFGIRFPWEALFFITVGLLSEVVDAMFLSGALNVLSPDLGEAQNAIIAYIVGAGCFFSMAFVGFQLGNRRYYTKIGERISYGFWISAGIALVAAKLLAGLVSGGLEAVIANEKTLADLLGSKEFISNAIVAAVQMVLYIGTGFMTRDSVRILTDNDLREYFLARKRYKNLLDELSEQRGDIVEDISKLKAYPKYAERLVESKRSVKKNVEQYNESARALIEAKMAITVEPDLMEDMYNNAMAKEGRSNKK